MATHEGSDEVVVILHAPGAELADAVHQGSHRVHVVAADPERRVELGADPRVRYVGSAPPPEVLDDLDASERLFVDGWLARAEPTSRPGDGRSWGAAGRLPPDPPRPQGGHGPRRRPDRPDRPGPGGPAPR